MRAHQNTWGRVSQAQKGIRKEMKRYGAFIVFEVLVWMLADMQTNHGGSNVHVQCFPTGRSEQKIMTS